MIVVRARNIRLPLCEVMCHYKPRKVRWCTQRFCLRGSRDDFDQRTWHRMLEIEARLLTERGSVEALDLLLSCILELRGARRGTRVRLLITGAQRLHVVGDRVFIHGQYESW